MPIFDYRCSECNTLYDILHKGKEIIEDVQCPTCGSHKHTKLISIPSIVTKGQTGPQCDPGSCGMDRTCCGSVCGIN